MDNKVTKPRYCYYYTFEAKGYRGWRICSTDNDLETVTGLNNFIEELTKEHGEILLTYWKGLMRM